jgi:hypothetical protein
MIIDSFREGESLHLVLWHHNDDIIYETDTDFNAFFRQSAKLVNVTDGQLFFCAKQPKKSGNLWKKIHLRPMVKVL